jgi:1,4-dihydroxy-2-naphthoyl-CoA hydrolase
VPKPTAEEIQATIAGTFAGDLGIEPLELRDDLVRGRLRVDRRHLHSGGFAHGGVWVALADTVAAWGATRLLGTLDAFTTVELKLNLLGFARDGDTLTADGVPLHIGRRTQVWEVKVHNGERLGALLVCTQLVLAGR